jgi:hypothetical protein
MRRMTASSSESQFRKSFDRITDEKPTCRYNPLPASSPSEISGKRERNEIRTGVDTCHVACAVCQNKSPEESWRLNAMPGKVFISCGQRNHERKLAERIAALLRDEFHLVPYLAFKTQSLNDIMIITEELRSSDYYLFLDFLRAPTGDQDIACSLFTH